MYMYEIDEFLLNFHLKSLHHLRKTVKQLGKHIKNIIEGRLWLSSSSSWKTETYQPCMVFDHLCIDLEVLG